MRNGKPVKRLDASKVVSASYRHDLRQRICGCAPLTARVKLLSLAPPYVSITRKKRCRRCLYIYGQVAQAFPRYNRKYVIRCQDALSEP